MLMTNFSMLMLATTAVTGSFSAYEKKDNHWQILEQALPQWIIATEKALSDLITEEGF